MAYAQVHSSTIHPLFQQKTQPQRLENKTLILVHLISLDKTRPTTSISATIICDQTYTTKQLLQT